jgi:predicted PurR-regulated permease PerM
MFDQKITFDKFIRGTLIALMIFAVLYIMNYLSSVLLPFFIAWLLAYLLYPMVKFVQYKMHIKVRALAIIITMIFVTAIFAGVLYLIIPPMLEQFQKLGDVGNKVPTPDYSLQQSVIVVPTNYTGQPKENQPPSSRVRISAMH